MDPLPEQIPLTTDPAKMVHKLHLAIIASCTCMTKTPVVEWHSELCHYRLFSEATYFAVMTEGLQKLKDELEEELDWVNKGNAEFHALLAEANAAVKQANLERDGYKYRLETLEGILGCADGSE